MQPEHSPIARDLLAYFDVNRRDMPWRNTSDPYAIWISEVMLQQTRVDTAIPYYHRWLEQFPDVDTLACADSQDVLRAWEGLGYYSRARNLHAAARVLRERHSSRLPDTAEALRSLPGIGDYTAGAIASVAFQRQETAVDGNARRVASRLFDMPDPSIRDVQKILHAHVPVDRPGDFNQAVMELGATICTPKRPQCAACPVHRHCAALVNDTVAIRPGAKSVPAAPVFDIAVSVLIGPDATVLLQQRAASGLLASMWQFPALAVDRGTAASAARRNAAALLNATRLPRARKLAPVRHLFSHRTEMYHPFIWRLDAWPGLDQADDLRIVDPETMIDLPMPVAQRRIARDAGLADAAPLS